MTFAKNTIYFVVVVVVVATVPWVKLPDPIMFFRLVWHGAILLFADSVTRYTSIASSWVLLEPLVSTFFVCLKHQLNF